MDEFKLVSDYKPTGDQPQAINALTEGLFDGLKEQVLLGVTGSGKTFTMANIIKNANIDLFLSIQCLDPPLQTSSHFQMRILS